MPDLGVAQHFLLAAHQFFEEVDCGVIIGRKEDAHLASQKIKDLSLASVLGAELLRVHPYGARLGVFDALIGLVGLGKTEYSSLSIGVYNFYIVFSI